MKDWVAKSLTGRYEVTSKIFDSDWEVSPWFLAAEVAIIVLIVILTK